MTPAIPNPGDWLTPAAARSALAVSDHTLRRLARSGVLRTLRVTRARRGPAAERVFYARADVVAITGPPAGADPGRV